MWMVRLVFFALCQAHLVPGLLINSEHMYTLVASSLHPQFLVIADSRLPNTHPENILANYGKELTRDVKSSINGRRRCFPASVSLSPD
jgi:hypothetical protein